MKLTVWTYEGPPHVGAMRIAASMRGVHYVLHAPQGDTYADLLFTMIERSASRPPVTYTTFQARDLGADTAELVKRSIREAVDRFRPDALLVGESCTAELIQDQPGALAEGMALDVPVVPLELPAYSRKENWGASETFYQMARRLVGRRGAGGSDGESRAAGASPPDAGTRPPDAGTRTPRANLLGPTTLGFRCRDDVREVERLLHDMGVHVNVTAPAGATPADLRRLPEADFNVCLYPEVAEATCRWLEREFGQPWTRTVPIGTGATRRFLAEVAEITGCELPSEPDDARFPWYSRSIDSTYLTGKRVFIFGDATHASAAARIAADELGFEVVGLGTYSREQARTVRDLARELGVEALITDDYLEVEAEVQRLAPELVLGTQMERHIAKRLGVPCAVISAPFHVQDCPARYSPQMGWEGANVIFDSWVHPLMMGLEEHLVHMFRDDFEFNDAAPSHLGGDRQGRAETGTGAAPARGDVATAANGNTEAGSADGRDGASVWTLDAEAELKKIPFFVRGKARNNTERFAAERGLNQITIETLYDAKAHFGR